MSSCDCDEGFVPTGEHNTCYDCAGKVEADCKMCGGTGELETVEPCTKCTQYEEFMDENDANKEQTN